MSQTPALRGSITVAHVARSDTFDTYGARSSNGSETLHMANTEPPASGWLGNPYVMDEDTPSKRQHVIALYLADFLHRVETDPDFREAVEGLRGQTVACWCRGVTQERTPETWCHLDVVAAWLDGDLSPVHDYLRTEVEP